MAPPILREGELIAPFACMHTFALPIPILDSDIVQVQQKEDDEQASSAPASSSEQVATLRVMSEPPCSFPSDAEISLLRSQKRSPRFSSAPPSTIPVMAPSASSLVLDANEVDQSLGAEKLSVDPLLSSTPPEEPLLLLPSTPLDAKPVKEAMLAPHPSSTSPIISTLQLHHPPIPGPPIAVTEGNPSTIEDETAEVAVSDDPALLEVPSEIVNEGHAKVECREQTAGSPRSSISVLPPTPDVDSDSDSSSEEPLARLLKLDTTKAKGLASMTVSAQSHDHGTVPKTMSSPTSQTILLPRKLSGELEIRVAQDQSHLFLAGQRTIVRLRLLG